MSEHDEHDHPSAWGPHDWHHGAPHNSWSPLIMSIGIGIFLFMLAGAFSNGVYDASYVPMVLVGILVIFCGLIVWWRQDMSFDGHYEPLARGVPFKNIQIRKVAMWIFLMSEMMVFTSLFTTYIRYRTGIENCQTIFERGDWIAQGYTGEAGEAINCFEPASALISTSWFHIAPGAINTFALIISSFTIVQALRYAKMPVGTIDEDVRRKRIYRYLGSTWFLACLFLTLKLIEWFVGFTLPDFLAEFNHGHTHIASLYEEGYLINAEHYHRHDGSWHDPVTGATMLADIRVSASTFYVTTGTHGLHVALGIIGLTYMTFKAWTGGYTPDNAVSIEYFGLYWHFVDLVWVLVFPFFYLY